MLCPVCNIDQPPGNRFCEDCGARLAPSSEASPAPAVPAGPVCPECGAGPEEVDADGFCARCGHERIAPARDHFEVVVSPQLAAVSDRGKRHHRNEDFVTIAATAHGEALVVCDGVSSSQNADQASEAAANAACAVLRDGLGSHETAAVLTASIRAAQKAVVELPWTRGLPADPPESAIVAAIRRGKHLTVGWIGDCRAYLITPAGGRLLTRDHSWVNEVIAAGKMTLPEALRSPQAHALTRTLGGPDAPPDEEPEIVALELPPQGCLVLCSDGLWNCVASAGQLAELARPGTEALAVAQRLVRYACDRSGHDNITAAVLAFNSPLPEGEGDFCCHERTVHVRVHCAGVSESVSEPGDRPGPRRHERLVRTGHRR